MFGLSTHCQIYLIRFSYILNSEADLRTWISRIFKVFDERYLLFFLVSCFLYILLFSREKHFSREEQVQYSLC